MSQTKTGAGPTLTHKKPMPKQSDDATTRAIHSWTSADDDDYDYEVAQKERQAQRQQEHDETAAYLQMCASELAVALGVDVMRYSTIRRQLARVWREAQRVAAIHKDLGVEPPK